MYTDDDEPRFYCGGCGLIFGPDDIPQETWDDMHCPDCGSQDLGGMSEVQS